MKRIGWKIIAGPTSAYLSANDMDRSSAIDLKIQKYLKDGWVLKGEMIRAHPSATLWTQIIEKYASE
jgi:hypothetical protein